MGRDLFSSPPCPDWLWYHPDSYPVGTRGSFPRVKLPGHEADTDFNLVLRIRMCRAIPLLPHTSSWCGAYLSTGYIFMLWNFVKPGHLYLYLSTV